MPDFSIEKQYAGPVCGIDEVGRGPLAGPVVAACVMFHDINIKHDILSEIKDSKKISLKKREQIAEVIPTIATVGIGIAEVEEIDRINILNATYLAMTRAFDTMCDKIDVVPSACLIDGRGAPDLPCQTQSVIKGDNISLSIAAAAIMAKVYRDRLMLRLANDFPQYSWDTNAGYGTAAHILALNEHGITPHHRKSFKPI